MLMGRKNQFLENFEVSDKKADTRKLSDRLYSICNLLGLVLRAYDVVACEFMYLTQTVV